jgi:hypothetical protein
MNNEQTNVFPSPIKSPEKPKIFLDRSKIIDLFYYSYKIKENVNSAEDNERALILAKSLNLK